MARPFFCLRRREIDIILSPALGGVVIGYEIGRHLKKETIFCERVNGQFKLRRGFSIEKNSRVLIVEDVITTGKSSLECSGLAKKAGAEIVGYACIIDRSNGKILYGKIPPDSVVVPGSLPSKSNPDGLALYCVVIMKQIDEKTRSKTSINDLLRE